MDGGAVLTLPLTLPSTLTLTPTRLGSRVNAVRSKRRYLKDRPDREARLAQL